MRNFFSRIWSVFQDISTPVWRNRITRILIILFGFILVLFVLMFFLGRSFTSSEWNSRLQPRTPAQMRGILNAMTEFRNEPPNFMPQSALDDEMCAMAVGNAVNFILGEDRLDSSSAWLFSRTNAKHLKTVYDREKDFTIVDGRIIESVDRGFRLSKILKPNGLYILGYHYRETRSDGKIIAAKADLNSHLMLLLNKDDGRWWGYHLIHYKDHDSDEYPLHIESIDKMPKFLDLVYIWQVNGVELPRKGDDIALVSNALPYSKVHGWIGYEGLGEYYVDTAMVALMNMWHGADQFPSVVDLADQRVVVLPLNGDLYHGKVLGFYNKVPVYYHGGVSERSKYGLEFQCVELANRYYASIGHHNMTRSGHADSYFWNAKRKGLKSYANGSSTKPEVDDLLVFDSSNSDGRPGHVAVISSVEEYEVCIVQQNVGTRMRECLPLKFDDGKWFIENTISAVAIPIAGWSRRGGK